MNVTTDHPRIPLSALHLSPLNARKTRTGDVDDLAASIAAHGLLQNLTVTVNSKPGEFEVVAGGRRLAAMQQLEREGRLPEALQAGVPCLVIEDNDVAHEASTAENTLREAMHPADQFEAFSRMVEAGKPVEDIAAHFGVSETVVKQRLKMANVAPDLFALYREGRMQLSQLQALAVTDDHDAQRKAWDVPHEYMRNAHLLRDRLTKGGVDASSALARFVGVEAYEAAGGPVRRDLFNGDAWLEDRALLDKLALDRMETHAQELRDKGWSWVETHHELDMSLLSQYGHLNACPDEIYTPEQEARLDAIHKRQQEIDDVDSDELSPTQSDELFAEARRLEREEETIQAEAEEKWPADVMQKSGVVIGIDRNGELVIEAARLKPGQKAGKDGGVAGTAKPTATAKGAKPKKPDLSADLTTTLLQHRAAAIRATLVTQPGLAGDLLLTALVGQLFGNAHYGLFDVRATDIHDQTAGKAQDLVACEARKRVDEARKALAIPRKQGDVLPWIQKLDDAAWSQLFGVCAAHMLHNLGANDLRAFDAVLPIDMASWWTVGAENFLARVSKPLILEAVAEARGKDAAAKLATLKRDPLIAEAGKLLAGTGWLPKPLRGPGYALKPAPAKSVAKKPAAKKAAAKAKPAAKPNAKKSAKNPAAKKAVR